MLPPDDTDPGLVGSKLTDVAGVVHAAYQIAAEMLKVVAPEDEAADSDEPATCVVDEQE